MRHEDANNLRPDPFNLLTLAEWLGSQPRAKRYPYSDCDRCVLHSYFEAMGFVRPRVGTWLLFHGEGMQTGIELPPHFNTIATQRPHTFGAAHDRAMDTAMIKAFDACHDGR